MAKPPPFVVPPAPQKGSKNQQKAINYILSRYPGLRQWMPTIRQASNRWGIDVVYVLSVLSIEAGSGNPNARNQGSGATGLAQMWDQHVNKGNNRQQYNSFIAEYGDRMKGGKDQARNPVWAINYMAWRLTGGIRTYGNIDDAYHKGYNPNQPQVADPSSRFPAWYQGQAKAPPSPQDTAGRSQDTSQARQQLAGKNPYLQGYAFTQAWHGTIDPIYEAYAGRGATKAEAAEAIKNGWSAYHIQVQLSQKKSFINSPVWKSNAPGYQAIYRSIYGNVRPPNLLVGYAIVHNLGSSFADVLRQGKGYVKSQEFKGNATSMANVYRKIFGEPDLHGLNVIDRVTAAGWSADQFADYLRKQPDYTKSNEFRQAGGRFASIFGNVTTLTQQQADQPLDLQGAPTDPRLPNYDGGQAPPPAPAKSKKKSKAPGGKLAPAPVQTKPGYGGHPAP